MSITPYLGRFRFDPEVRLVMDIAFEMARAALRDRADIPPEVVAAKIIQLAKKGERDPDRMCERALRNILRRRAATPSGTAVK
jgi:hypothetical protein